MTSEPQATARPAIHWLSVGQFSLSLLAATLLWSMAGSAALAGLVGVYQPALFAGDITSLFLLAASLAFMGLLLVPSAYFAFLRLSGRQHRQPVFRISRWLRPTVLIFTFPLVILAGYWVSQNAGLDWLFLPPLHLLAIVLPIWWLVYLGMRGLPSGSHQRAWGVFGSGLVLGPFLILSFEILVLVFFVVVAGFYLATRPDISQDIINLVQRLPDATLTPDLVPDMVRPYLLQPVVVYTVLIFGAILVPMMEEFLKPIGVWLLAGSTITPGAGFAAGLLSGAGFALFESLAYTSNADDWAFAVIARLGTAVMHIMTASLVGWALALAWRQGSYFRLAITYLVAVLVHGLWNAITLLGAGYALIPNTPQEPSFFYNLAGVAPLVIAFMAFAMFVFLVWANYHLRKSGGRVQPDSKSVL